MCAWAAHLGPAEHFATFDAQVADFVLLLLTLPKPRAQPPLRRRQDAGVSRPPAAAHAPQRRRPDRRGQHLFTGSVVAAAHADPVLLRHLDGLTRPAQPALTQLQARFAPLGADASDELRCSCCPCAAPPTCSTPLATWNQTPMTTWCFRNCSRGSREASTRRHGARWAPTRRRWAAATSCTRKPAHARQRLCSSSRSPTHSSASPRFSSFHGFAFSSTSPS